MIKGVIYSIKQAFKQIFRNKGMSVASVFSITAMMLILALFLFLTVNLNFITENVKVFLEAIVMQTIAAGGKFNEPVGNFAEQIAVMGDKYLRTGVLLQSFLDSFLG